METPGKDQDFEGVKARLDEIVKAVSDDELPLDDALELYEEAVMLGLRVSDLLEEGIDPVAEVDASDDAQSEEAAQDGAASDSESEQEAASDSPVSAE
jgi:exodeoxyribonuclease VII small subunit